MCYKGKCFYYIPVENGCLAFAIVSAIGSGVALLACIIWGLLLATGVIVDPPPQNRDVLVNVFAIVLQGLLRMAIAVVGVTSLVGFIFSVLLCNGICNRRPGQVKSYFVYGVVSTVLTVLCSIILLSSGDEPTPNIVALVVCVIYSPFLVLVYQTYTKLCADAGIKDHIHLVETA